MLSTARRRFVKKTSLYGKSAKKSSHRAYSTAKSVRVLRSTSNNAFVNLATEEYLFNHVETDRPIMFLWRNGPTVVIGKHQNPWKECKVAEMEAKGVTLARRRSGGGAVYQDLGNSIFTFLNSKADHSLDRNFGILQRAIESLGVKTTFSGRNDVLVDGRKISGSAFKNLADRSYHHGTVLVNINKDDVERYLTVNKLKLQSKGVDSVRQRITNLTDFTSSATHEALSEALIREFCQAYGQDPASISVEELQEAELLKIPELRSIHDELSSWAWRFGHTPEFQLNLETRFPWGIIDLYITYEDGKITESKLFSDTLYPAFVDAVQKNIVGATYNASGINQALDKAKTELAGTPAEPHVDELRQWLLAQL
jgi:lipoate-protein ligase A